MQRVTVSLDDALAKDFDELARSRGYASRSEAVRDLLREAVTAPRTSESDGHCVGNLSYVYDHHERQLATRLAEMQHAHHDLVLATCHVHLDHDTCLETVMLRGTVQAVRALVDRVSSERGVRHAALNLIAVSLDHDHPHDHDHVHNGTPHYTPI